MPFNFTDFYHLPFVEIVVRAIAVYLFIILALRVFGKKELAQLSVVDLVFILLISNAVQNAMVGPDTSLSGGLVAAGALFAANFTFKKLLYKNENLNRLLQGDPVLLIYNGEVQEKNCQQAEISIAELHAAIREHGVDDISEVNLAMLEVDGNISVISKGYQKRSTIPRKHKLKSRIVRS